MMVRIVKLCVDKGKETNKIKNGIVSIFFISLIEVFGYVLFFMMVRTLHMRQLLNKF